MKSNHKEIRKPKPFIAPGSTQRATSEEIKRREEMKRMAMEIGEKTSEVDSSEECENPYRAKALMYIAQGKQVPEEIKRKIKEFDIKLRCEKHKKSK